jgi:hypothetical protein
VLATVSPGLNYCPVCMAVCMYATHERKQSKAKQSKATCTFMVVSTVLVLVLVLVLWT